MELTKGQRTFISRATAAAFGLFLVYLAVGCFHWGEGLRTDVGTADAFGVTASNHGNARAATPLFLPYALMVAFAGLGVVFVGFAVVPTRWLYAVSPSPASTDGDDLFRGVLESFLP